MKAVIATNRSSEPAAIVQVAANSGVFVCFFDEQHTDFIIDLNKQVILGTWGGVEKMTDDEAHGFGADFGVWFTS